MNIDEALEAAKPLGRAQIFIVVVTMLMNIETAFTMLGNVFLAGKMPYHCTNHSGFSLEESVPFTDEAYSTCLEYSNPESADNETRDCTSWEFDTTGYRRTIVSEWSLVCDKDVFPDLSQTLILTGFAVGSILGGPVADRYGRRPTVIVALVLFNALGLSVSLAQSYATFVVLRFLSGAVFKAVRIPIMNLLFESLVPRHRPFIGLIPACMVAGGLMMMAGIAYLVRDWRYLNIILMIPTIIIMIFSWFIPESVRWLISQNKHEEAEDAIQKLASFNKVKKFPSPAFSKEEESKSLAAKEEEEEGALSSNGKNEGGIRVLLQLFKQPTLTVTLILSWNWITCGLAYFGFALATGTLAGDPYLNFFISSSADMIGFLIATSILKRFGTPRLLISGLLSSASAMISIVILRYASDSGLVQKILLTIFSLTGRLLITLAILPCILMMSDLFPTTIRNSGTSIVHLIGNIGGLSSPLVLYMNKFSPNFSSILIISCCMLAAALSLLLPETVGTIQPDNPADLQKMFDNNRIIKFGKKATSEDTTFKDDEPGGTGQPLRDL